MGQEMKSLTAPERGELERLEGIIERGLQTFYEVGAALLTIRDGRLYRETHGTFEDYCRGKWGMTHRHANRMIEASAIVAHLGPMGPIPSSERQARELAGLEPDEQREVWRKAVETAPNGKVTAAHIRSIVQVETYKLQLLWEQCAPEDMKNDERIKFCWATAGFLNGEFSLREIRDLILQSDEFNKELERSPRHDSLARRNVEYGFEMRLERKIGVWLNSLKEEGVWTGGRLTLQKILELTEEHLLIPPENDDEEPLDSLITFIKMKAMNA